MADKKTECGTCGGPVCTECGAGGTGSIKVGPGSFSVGHGSPTTVGSSPEEMKKHLTDPMRVAIGDQARKTRGVLEKILSVLMAQPAAVDLTSPTTEIYPISPGATPEARGIKAFIALAYFFCAIVTISIGFTGGLGEISTIRETQAIQVLNAESYKAYRLALASPKKELTPLSDDYQSLAKERLNKLTAHHEAEERVKADLRAQFRSIGSWLTIVAIGFLIGLISLVQMQALLRAELTMPPANANGIRSFFRRLRHRLPLHR